MTRQTMCTKFHFQLSIGTTQVPTKKNKRIYIIYVHSLSNNITFKN